MAHGSAASRRGCALFHPAQTITEVTGRIRVPSAGFDHGIVSDFSRNIGGDWTTGRAMTTRLRDADAGAP